MLSLFEFRASTQHVTHTNPILIRSNLLQGSTLKSSLKKEHFSALTKFKLSVSKANL